MARRWAEDGCGSKVPESSESDTTIGLSHTGHVCVLRELAVCARWVVQFVVRRRTRTPASTAAIYCTFSRVPGGLYRLSQVKSTAKGSYLAPCIRIRVCVACVALSDQAEALRCELLRDFGPG